MPPRFAPSPQTLTAADIGVCRLQEPLSRHCYWRIGGPADVLVEPTDAGQLARALALADRHGAPVVIYGDGSNLLFDDAGVRGMVIRIGRAMASLNIQNQTIEAQAGVWAPRLARRAAQAGLAGLEHIVGVPGTLGGLVVMNGGSLQQSIGDVIRRVQIVTRQGAIQNLSPEECRFAYRASALQGAEAVVVSARLELPPGDSAAIRTRMLEILRERRQKFPLKQPNCGSVFVRNLEMFDQFGPPGKVIEETGLKGLRIGDAQISHKHANFIVNLGAARSADVLELIRAIRRRVFDRVGHWLTCEARYVSPDGRIIPAHEAVETMNNDPLSRKTDNKDH